MNKLLKRTAVLLACVMFLTSCGTVQNSQSSDTNDSTTVDEDRTTFVQQGSSDTSSEDDGNIENNVQETVTDFSSYPITMIPKEDLTPVRFSAVSGSGGNVSSGNTDIEPYESERPAKDFTLMIYMIGSTLEYDEANGIIGYATADIAEMLSAGVDFDKVNIIVYTGGTQCWAGGIPSNHNCVLDLSKYAGEDNLRKCVVAASEDIPNMGEAGTFAAFLNFCCGYYPAENYGLICWDHGGGPMWGFGMDVRYDGDSLSLSEMEAAMKQTEFAGNKLSFIGFDACLMGSIETAAVWEDYADYLVASEDIEPGVGWNYTGLGQLNSAGEDTGTFLESWVKFSGETMSSGGGSATLSVMDLSKTDLVVDSLVNMFEVVMDEMISGSNIQIQRIRYQSREFGKMPGQPVNYDLVDIYDFADKLSAYCGTESEAVKKSISDFIVYDYSNIQNAHGVTVYYPSSQLSLYDDVFSENYEPVSPSSSYTEYLEDYSSICQNGVPASGASESGSNEADETETEAPETAEPETAEPEAAEPTAEEPEIAEPETDDTAIQTVSPDDPQKYISFQLTPEQNDKFVSAYYNIYRIDDSKSDDNEVVVFPVVIQCEVEPDKDGTIRVPADPYVLYGISDENAQEILWVMRQVELESDYVEYESVTSRLTPGCDFADITDWNLPISIHVRIKGSEEPVITGITPSEEGNMSNAKADIDLTKWDGINVSNVNFNVKKNQSGTVLPLYEWERAGTLIWKPLYVDEEFGFEYKPLSEADNDFVCQVIIKDTDGNTGTSELVPLSKTDKESFTYDTGNGSMEFVLYTDHAELTKYEGDDTSVVIPDTVDGHSVTVIGNRAFYNCDTINEIVISEGVIDIEADSFSECSGLESVTIPSSIKEIKAYAFQRCEALRSIELPEGLEWLGKGCFSKCSSLEKITIPASLTRIGNAVFTECKSLRRITVEEGCQACRMQDNVLLSGDGKKVIAVPMAETSYVKIPEGVETVSYGTFARCKQLKHVEFPSSLLTIENYAFYGCENLIGIVFPEQLKWIGTGSFEGFHFDSTFGTAQKEEKELSSVTIGANVLYIGSNAFGALHVDKIEVSGNNANYHSVNGFLTNAAEDYIIEAPSALSGQVVIPEGIAGLNSRLFESNSNITDVYIPASVVDIGDWLFRNKDKVTIHGKKGSYAETYANEQGIVFIEE